MRHGCGHAAITEEEALRHTLNMWLDYRRLAAQAGAAKHPDRDSAMPYDLLHATTGWWRRKRKRARTAGRAGKGKRGKVYSHVETHPPGGLAGGRIQHPGC